MIPPIPHTDIDAIVGEMMRTMQTRPNSELRHPCDWNRRFVAPVVKPDGSEDRLIVLIGISDDLLRTSGSGVLREAVRYEVDQMIEDSCHGAML